MKTTEPVICGIAHVAVYTNRFEDTLSFYKEVFEAREIGHPNTARRGCLLTIGTDELEIFESAALPDGVIKHFAINCRNTDEMFQRALSAGASSYMEPKEITVTRFDEKGEPVDHVVRAAFVRGLAEEQIELFQEC